MDFLFHNKNKVPSFCFFFISIFMSDCYNDSVAMFFCHEDKPILPELLMNNPCCYLALIEPSGCLNTALNDHFGYKEALIKYIKVPAEASSSPDSEPQSSCISLKLFPLYVIVKMSRVFVYLDLCICRSPM